MGVSYFYFNSWFVVQEIVGKQWFLDFWNIQEWKFNSEMGVFGIFEQFHSLGDFMHLFWIVTFRNMFSVHVDKQEKSLHFLSKVCAVSFFFIKENVGSQFLYDMLDIF